MRIALFHNVVSGGAKRAIYDSCRVLKSNGHTIDLFILDTANSEFLPLDNFIDNKFVFPVKKLLPDYTDRSIKSIFKWLASQTILKKKEALIADKINMGGYDVCFVHLCVYTQAPYILRYLTIPSVYYCHEPLRIAHEEFVEGPRQRLISTLCNFYSKTFLLKEERRNIAAASLVITNSYFTREYILRAYGINSFVSYFAVDSDKFKPLKTSKENIVLTVGAFHPRKGFRFLIRAIAKIDETIRPKLIIIGDKYYYNELKELTSLAAENNVLLETLYNISDEELIGYYNKAKVFVYAPYLEPFGLAPLEAMSCAVPVVAVCEGGVRETVINNLTGILVERDEEEFATAITFLLTNEKAGEKTGIEGRDYVRKKWAWQNSYEMLIKNFNRAIKSYSRDNY